MRYEGFHGLHEVSKMPYASFTGDNNSGKSLALFTLRSTLGEEAYLCGTNRFGFLSDLKHDPSLQTDMRSLHSSFQNETHNDQTNFEQNWLQLSSLLVSYKDKQRAEVFDLCGELIGAKFSLQRRDPDNEISARYVDMDGQPLSAGSTGTRLLMTLIAVLKNSFFSHVLIDEPELGLSPRLQANLAHLIMDPKRRALNFPHLTSITVSTHSHLFLDKSNVNNNFSVRKAGKTVTFKRMSSMSELNRVQFNMLGNSLEDLFLPSAIIICEGKTDKPFFDRLIQLRFPNKKILVLESQGDVKRVFRSLTTNLGDFHKSPFRDRTFIILDSVHSRGTKEELSKLGAPDDRIVVWDKNGIEYIYPPSLVANVFGCGEGDLNLLSITSDNVTVGEETRRKVALAEEVITRMRSDTEHNSELTIKLLRPLAEAIGE